MPPSTNLLPVYIVKIRFKGGALWRSLSLSLVHAIAIRTSGEQEEESVLPSVRPSIRSAPNDSDRLDCGISRAATVQKSLVKSCAVKLFQFRRRSSNAVVLLHIFQGALSEFPKRPHVMILLPLTSLDSAFMKMQFKYIFNTLLHDR